MLKKRSGLMMIMTLAIMFPIAVSAAALSNWETYDTSSTKNGFPGVTALSMMQDSYGNIWFGTNNGAVKLSDDSVWTVYDTSDGLVAQSTFDILEDSSHNFWFGSNGSGVTKMSSDEKTFTIYTTANSGLVSNYVTKLLEDKDGFIWFGTSGGGISVLNPTTYLWTSYTNASGLPGNNVQDLMLDNEGNVWVATQNGVAVYYYTTKTWKTFLAKNTYSLAQDDSNKIWMGTNSDGIYRLNPTDSSWIHHDSTSGLTHNMVRDITVDENGNIWATCYYYGVYFYNTLTGKWKSYTSSNSGFLTNNCCGIMIDSDGYFWFSIQTKGVQKATYYPYTIDGSNVIMCKGIEAGASKKYSFSISADLPVTLANGESWLGSFPTSSIVGDSAVCYAYPLTRFSNSDPVYLGRTGNINILDTAGTRITSIYVLQYSLFKFSTDTLYVDSIANSVNTITVKADTAWTTALATKGGSWASVDRTSGDSSQTTLTITTLLANSGADRIGWLAFTAADVSDTIFIVQKGSGGITSNKADNQTNSLKESVYSFTSSGNMISYNLPKTSPVSLKVYNLKGNLVASLSSSMQAAGKYEANNIVNRLATGQYICRFTAGSFSSQKMLHIIR